MAKIYNDKSDTLLSGTSGDDTMQSGYVKWKWLEYDCKEATGVFPENVTIVGGAGNDSIVNYGSKVSIASGDNADTIFSGQGDWESYDDYHYCQYFGEPADNTTLDGGGGNDFISNENGSNVIISGGVGNDSIWNDGDYSTLYGGAGNDYIDNDGSDVTLDGGAGNDTIYNRGSDVTISGGVGNDSIWNNGDYSIIMSGGDGDDKIFNGGGDNSSIEGGSGNDSIYNGNDSVTISGGTGNDTINNLGDNVLIKYTAGDGNDIIYGFNSTSTLSISSADYSTQSSGNDIIVTVDNETILLKNIYTVVDTLNINDNAIMLENKPIELGDDNDYVKIIRDGMSIDSGAGNDSLYNDGSNVTISGGEGDDSIRNYGGANVMIDGGADSDTVSNTGSNALINVGEGNDSVYNYASYVSINGGAGDDTISLGSNSKHALIVYNEGDGNDIIRGFNDISMLQIGNGTGTYGTLASGSDIIIYVGDGSILLIDVASLSDLNIDGIETELPIWQINGNIATYGTSSDAIITISGVKSLGGLSIEENVVTIAKSALNQSNVTISDGYTLKLADDVPQPTTEQAAVWKFSGNVATYKDESISAGYELVDNQIIYNDASDGETLITVNGVKSADGLSLNGNVVTVAATALNKTDVTISDDYILKLAEDAPTPQTTAAGWTFKGNVATYKNESTSAGYELVDNQIVYTPASGGETLIKVRGVKSADGLSLNGNVVTVAAKALNKTDVTISDGYTLEFDNAVPQLKTEDANWILNDNVATYTGVATLAGYSLSDDSKTISYVEDKSGEIVTLSSVKSLDGLSINNKIVTVEASALNQANVTITDGYKLALGEDVPPLTIANANWIINDSLATYKNTPPIETYRLSNNNQIIYTAAGDDDILVELGGISSEPTFDESESIIRLAENNIEENISIVSNSYGYKFEIGSGSYSQGTKFIGSDNRDTLTNNGEYLVIETGKGNDFIVNNSKNASISGGKGNDKIINNGDGGNTFIYTSGDGKDNVVGFTATDTIKLLDAAQISANVKGNDVIFNIDNGSITLKEVATMNAAISLVDSLNSPIDISSNVYSTDGVISDDKIILSTTFDSLYTANEFEIVDSSQLTKGISIDGGAKGISLIGGSGKDTLISGEKDFELTGGKGNDVFVYNGGKGRIKDYSQKGTYGKDKLELASEFNLDNLKDFKYSSDELTLNYGDGNELTLERIRETTEITFGTKSSTIRTFKAEGMFDEKGKSATLASSNDYFKAQGNFSKLEMIDGSKTSGSIIIGNKKANYIIAGAGGSTLEGGKGKDTLVGGDGSDVFVYDAKNGAGNKLIKNYGEGDLIIFEDSATISDVKTKGDDLELKVGSNKITIEGGAGKSFTFIEDNVEKIYTADGLITDGEYALLTNSFNGSAEALAGYSIVNAGLLKKSVNLIGNDNTNLWGGKGNDTLTAGTSGSELWGNKGNDVLIGDVGEDKFIFRAGEGNDTIQGYSFDDGDLLQIYDKHGNESTFNKAVFSGDTLTLSVKGGGKIILNGVSAGDSFLINNTIHTINGKKLS